MDTAISYLGSDLASVSVKIKEGELSPVDLVAALLDRIATEDPKINAYITVNKQEALALAKERAKEIKNGEYRGPFHGIPIGLKDLIDVKGVRTTCGSEIYENHVAEENAEIVTKLTAAGAIIIGKLNTHQFAYGPTGDRSHFGPARNPYNTGKMTGGSSSGSAAAVAACLCFGAIGTDTGGSVRIPASFCGIVGMKPTYGRVSKRGIHPLSWTLDHAGPMTRTIKDNALLLNVIAGYDPLDPDAVKSDPEDFTRLLGEGLKGKKIGIPTNFFFDGLDAEVDELVKQSIQIFKEMGLEAVEVNLPNINEMVEAHKTILRSEAYAVHEENLKNHPEKWDDEVKERLHTGLETSGVEFAKALQTRKAAKQDFNEILDGVDILLTPTVPILPLDVNSRFLTDSTDDGQHIRWKILKLTNPTNLNGFPSLSMPCGFTKEGMPVGVQLIGKEFEEAKLYQFGYALEQSLSLSTAKMDIK